MGLTHDNGAYVKLADAHAAFDSVLMSALVDWYHADPMSCAIWCDKKGDPRGALLGKVREAAFNAR